MVEVLSSARTQSVKEIKKRAKIKKRNKLIVKWFLIIIIVLALAFLIKNYILDNKHSFVDQTTGITFYSKDFYVRDVYKILASDRNISIVFNIGSKDINSIGDFTENIVYLQSVFSANNLSPVLIVNIMDSLDKSSRNIISCQSNLGDIYTNVELSSQECNDLINNSSTLFIVDFYDVNSDRSVVYSSVKEKYIYIQSKSKSDMDYAISLVSNMMFDDLELTEKKIQYLRNELNKQNTDSNILDVNLSEDTNFSDYNISLDINNSDINLIDQNL